MAAQNKETQAQRDNRRRDELNQAAKAGRSSSDPAERAKWQARDEAWTRHARPRDY